MSETEFVTFGCRLNAYESEVMRGQRRRPDLKDAIVFNTCAVTAEATRQARQAIRQARKDKPDAQHHRHRLRGADDAARCSPPCRKSISSSAMKKNFKPRSFRISASAPGARQGQRHHVGARDRLHMIDGFDRAHARLRAGAEWLRSSLHLLHHSLRPRQFALGAGG